MSQKTSNRSGCANQPNLSQHSSVELIKSLSTFISASSELVKNLKEVIQATSSACLNVENCEGDKDEDEDVEEDEDEEEEYDNCPVIPTEPPQEQKEGEDKNQNCKKNVEFVGDGTTLPVETKSDEPKQLDDKSEETNEVDKTTENNSDEQEKTQCNEHQKMPEEEVKKEDGDKKCGVTTKDDTENKVKKKKIKKKKPEEEPLKKEEEPPLKEEEKTVICPENKMDRLCKLQQSIVNAQQFLSAIQEEVNQIGKVSKECQTKTVSNLPELRLNPVILYREIMKPQSSIPKIHKQTSCHQSCTSRATTTASSECANVLKSSSAHVMFWDEKKEKVSVLCAVPFPTWKTY